VTVHHLHGLADEHLTTARAVSAARSATTRTHQGPLRPTLIALAAGAALHEQRPLVRRPCTSSSAWPGSPSGRAPPSCTRAR
jgi:hypothetical protein